MKKVSFFAIFDLACTRSTMKFDKIHSKEMIVTRPEMPSLHYFENYESVKFHKF